MDYIRALKDYEEFLGLYDKDTPAPSYEYFTQKEAKARLKEDLGYVINTNGYGELYESEKELCKQLNIKE